MLLQVHDEFLLFEVVSGVTGARSRTLVRDKMGGAYARLDVPLEVSALATAGAGTRLPTRKRRAVPGQALQRGRSGPRAAATAFTSSCCSANTADRLSCARI
jgi:hypothetical protein